MSSAARSAGLLLYRIQAGGLEVFLAHPGGPFWARRDDGAWTLPKGVPNPGEELVAAALREFEEETGTRPVGAPVRLGSVRQKGGKVVHGFALAGDLDAEACRSNTVELEWPRGSGRRLTVPEVDRFAWFPADVARRKINPAQAELIERLEKHLAG